MMIPQRLRPTQGARASILTVAVLLLAACGVPPYNPARWATRLHWAAEHRAPVQIRQLIKAGEPVDSRTDEETTPLMLAAARGSVANTRELIAAEADLNARDSWGGTALMYAVCARLNHAHGALQDPQDVYARVQALIAAGADIETRDHIGMTALIRAAHQSDLERIKILLDAGANPDAQDNDGRSVLMWGVENWRRGITQVLLNAGAEPNARDRAGRTALMWAAKFDSYIVDGHPIQTLLQAKSDIEAKDDDGWTALGYAAEFGTRHNVELLLEAGADSSAIGWTQLHQAAAAGDLPAIKVALQQRADVEARIADARKREPPSGNLRVPNHERPLIHAEDVPDIPAEDRRAQDDPFKRYILIGGRGDQSAPPEGYKVLLVLPGGSGSPDFHPFIKRIYRHVLSDEYLLAQIVAPEWDRQQAQKLVWPTTTNPHKSMRFTTEQFIDAVLDEIDQDFPIDERHIFVLAWSSSGPATYAIALQPNTRVTGAFVAMSVFKPQTLPPIENATGFAFYILHSPQDFIPIKHPQAARDQLRAAGATTKLTTYQGGHGWRGNVYQNLRDGIRWLEEQVAHNVQP